MGTKRKKALIVVDMQVDFVSGSLGTGEAKAIVTNICQKIRDELPKGTEILFTKDTHQENYLETQEGRKLPVPHCIRGTEGWEIIPELQEFADKVIEKPTFGSTALPEYVKDADTIELVGLCTDICVISNALLLKAYFPEKAIQVDSSCCAGATPQSHKNALEAMKMCQIDILDPRGKQNGSIAEGMATEGNTRSASVQEGVQPVNRVAVQTFGNFQVFVDGKPIQFHRSKSEELFAFLVDRRGAGVTNAEIASILFEDKAYSRSVKNQVQTIISQLMKTLREHNAENVIVRQWNSLAIDCNQIQCDYFDCLKQKDNDMMGFAGEYMAKYSWAEYTNGYLIQLKSGEIRK